MIRSWTKTIPVPPSLIMFSNFYRLWPCTGDNCAHSEEGEWVTPQRESKQVYIAKEKVRHVPEGGGGNFVKYPEGCTIRVACERETTK